MRWSLSWRNVTQYILVVTDVSGQPLRSVFKRGAVQESTGREWRCTTHVFFCVSWTALLLKMGLTVCYETSVTNYQSTLHNKPPRRTKISTEDFFTNLSFICNVWADYNVGTFVITIAILCQSHWPRGLRRKCTAARLMRS
jgi:hypothetical protein